MRIASTDATIAGPARPGPAMAVGAVPVTDDGRPFSRVAGPLVRTGATRAEQIHPLTLPRSQASCAPVDLPAACHRTMPDILHPSDRMEGDVQGSLAGATGPTWRYRRRPCAGCPWRIDQTGRFPPGQFRAVAGTTRDASSQVFRCHSARGGHPTVCAGFIVEGGVHNAGLRLLVVMGLVDPARVEAGRCMLHTGFRAMALANGADRADPALTGCRDADQRIHRSDWHEHGGRS